MVWQASQCTALARPLGSGQNAGPHHSDWNIQMLLEGVTLQGWSFFCGPENLVSKAGVFTVWASHSSHSKATEWAVELVFTAYPVLAGYWGCSSKQGRTE